MQYWRDTVPITTIDNNTNTLTIGVMTARALLSNPALFKGYTQTPVQCIKEFVSTPPPV